jgi:hypothetical protein
MLERAPQRAAAVHTLGLLLPLLLLRAGRRRRVAVPDR